MCCDLCTARPHWPFVSETSCNELHCKLQRRFSDHPSSKCIMLPFHSLFFVLYSIAIKQFLPFLTRAEKCLLTARRSGESSSSSSGSGWSPAATCILVYFTSECLNLMRLITACSAVEACWKGIRKGNSKSSFHCWRDKVIGISNSPNYGGHVPLSLMDWHSR